MRAFRLKRRLIKTKINDETFINNNKVTNQRDYVGLEKLLKHGFETYERYNHSWGSYTYKAELYENINGKWVRLSELEINEIFNLDN